MIASKVWELKAQGRLNTTPFQPSYSLFQEAVSVAKALNRQEAEHVIESEGAAPEDFNHSKHVQDNQQRYYTIGQYWHHAAANQEHVFNKTGSGTTAAAASLAVVLGNSSTKLHNLGNSLQGPRPEALRGDAEQGAAAAAAAAVHEDDEMMSEGSHYLDSQEQQQAEQIVQNHSPSQHCAGLCSNDDGSQPDMAQYQMQHGSDSQLHQQQSWHNNSMYDDDDDDGDEGMLGMQEHQQHMYQHNPAYEEDQQQLHWGDSCHEQQPTNHEQHDWHQDQELGAQAANTSSQQSWSPARSQQAGRDVTMQDQVQQQQQQQQQEVVPDDAEPASTSLEQEYHRAWQVFWTNLPAEQQQDAGHYQAHWYEFWEDWREQWQQERQQRMQQRWEQPQPQQLYNNQLVYDGNEQEQQQQQQQQLLLEQAALAAKELARPHAKEQCTAVCAKTQHTGESWGSATASGGSTADNSIMDWRQQEQEQQQLLLEASKDGEEALDNPPDDIIILQSDSSRGSTLSADAPTGAGCSSAAGIQMQQWSMQNPCFEEEPGASVGDDAVQQAAGEGCVMATQKGSRLGTDARMVLQGNACEHEGCAVQSPAAASQHTAQTCSPPVPPAAAASAAEPAEPCSPSSTGGDQHTEQPDQPGAGERQPQRGSASGVGGAEALQGSSPSSASCHAAQEQACRSRVRSLVKQLQEELMAKHAASQPEQVHQERDQRPPIKRSVSVRFQDFSSRARASDGLGPVANAGRSLQRQARSSLSGSITSSSRIHLLRRHWQQLQQQQQQERRQQQAAAKLDFQNHHGLLKKVQAELLSKLASSPSQTAPPSPCATAGASCNASSRRDQLQELLLQPPPQEGTQQPSSNSNRSYMRVRQYWATLDAAASSSLHSSSIVQLQSQLATPRMQQRTPPATNDMSHDYTQCQHSLTSAPLPQRTCREQSLQGRQQQHRLSQSSHSDADEDNMGREAGGMQRSSTSRHVRAADSGLAVVLPVHAEEPESSAASSSSSHNSLQYRTPAAGTSEASSKMQYFTPAAVTPEPDIANAPMAPQELGAAQQQQRQQQQRQQQQHNQIQKQCLQDHSQQETQQGERSHEGGQQERFATPTPQPQLPPRPSSVASTSHQHSLDHAKPASSSHSSSEVAAPSAQSSPAKVSLDAGRISAAVSTASSAFSYLTGFFGSRSKQRQARVQQQQQQQQAQVPSQQQPPSQACLPHPDQAQVQQQQQAHVPSQQQPPLQAHLPLLEQARQLQLHSQSPTIQAQVHQQQQPQPTSALREQQAQQGASKGTVASISHTPPPEQQAQQGASEDTAASISHTPPPEQPLRPEPEPGPEHVSTSLELLLPQPVPPTPPTQQPPLTQAAAKPPLSPVTLRHFIKDLPPSWQLPSTRLSPASDTTSSLELSMLQALSSSTLGSDAASAQQRHVQQAEAGGSTQLPESRRLCDSGALSAALADVSSAEFQQLMKLWSDAPLSTMLTSAVAAGVQQRGGAADAAAQSWDELLQLAGVPAAGGAQQADVLLLGHGRSSSGGGSGAGCPAAAPAGQLALAQLDPLQLGARPRPIAMPSAAQVPATSQPASPALGSPGPLQARTASGPLSASMRRISNAAHVCGSPGSSRQHSRAASSAGSLLNSPLAEAPASWLSLQDSWQGPGLGAAAAEAWAGNTTGQQQATASRPSPQVGRHSSTDDAGFS